MPDLNARAATVERETRETKVTISLALDGTGRADVATGIAFYDHMLASLALHARFDLTVVCRGDLDVDDHHTIEDVGLAIGTAFDRALGDRAGIHRFGSAYAPLDEALARAVVDCSGRPFSRINLGLARERLGAMSCENVAHALGSFATTGRITLHLDVLEGANDHHRAESAFKALALALRVAVAHTGVPAVPSTKGVLR